MEPRHHIIPDATASKNTISIYERYGEGGSLRCLCKITHLDDHAESTSNGEPDPCFTAVATAVDDFDNKFRMELFFTFSRNIRAYADCKAELERFIRQGTLLMAESGAFLVLDGAISLFDPNLTYFNMRFDDQFKTTDEL